VPTAHDLRALSASTRPTAGLGLDRSCLRGNGSREAALPKADGSLRARARAARATWTSKRSRGFEPDPSRTTPNSSRCAYTHDRSTPSLPARVAASTSRRSFATSPLCISWTTRKATASTHSASTVAGGSDWSEGRTCPSFILLMTLSRSKRPCNFFWACWGPVVAGSPPRSEARRA
jgi:hypothetical protein